MCCQLTARPPGSILHMQKLFQAVEEARGLLAEGAAAGRAQSALQQAGTRQPQRQLLPAPEAKQQAAHQQQPVQVPQYPAPVKDDMGKNAKQLLKWLKAAAVDPEVGQYRSCCSTQHQHQHQCSFTAYDGYMRTCTCQYRVYSPEQGSS